MSEWFSEYCLDNPNTFSVESKLDILALILFHLFCLNDIGSHMTAILATYRKVKKRKEEGAPSVSIACS